MPPLSPAKHSYLVPCSSLNGLRRKRFTVKAGKGDWDVVVLGAGAAGLTAGAFAANSKARTLVLERNSEAGKKILISGGTRCNVCPGSLDAQRDFTTESPRSALRSILASWNLPACLAWLQDDVQLQLAYEPVTEKWFPTSNSAKEVRDKLVQACAHAGAVLSYNTPIQSLQRTGSGWKCVCGDGTVHQSAKVVVATGGLSFPKLGTTGGGLRLLEEGGHTLVPPYPALTPLIGPHPGNASLAGISLYGSQLSCQPAPQAQPRAGTKRQAASASMRAAMLFTHRGFSGPAALDLSHHFTRPHSRGEPTAPHLVANWVVGTPQEAWRDLLEQPRGSESLQGALHQGGLPLRLAEALCREVGLPGATRVAQLKKGERARLLEALTRYPLVCTGHEGYAKAEVTGGGVPLSQVDCATVESARMPGVHLCGEVLDAFGRIGGFNFYWAWVTGRLAGLKAAELCQS